MTEPLYEPAMPPFANPKAAELESLVTYILPSTQMGTHPQKPLPSAQEDHYEGEDGEESEVTLSDGDR